MIRDIGWKNGKWQKTDDIKISIKDRGLRFGDALFETILIKNKKPVLLDEHIHRFQNNLKLLKFNNTIDYLLLEKTILNGINKLNIQKEEYGSIRINYSRGINITRSINIDSLNSNFNADNLWIEFYIIDLDFNPITVYISKEEKRNEHSLLSSCKTFNYIQSIQALIEANKKNFDDSILLNTKNELCCGTTFNLLLKRNNKWLTPRKESGCMPGIMISKLLDLKLIEEAYLVPDFKKDDTLVAINSLSCRQIIKVNDLDLISEFNPKNFWEILCN